MMAAVWTPDPLVELCDRIIDVLNEHPGSTRDNVVERIGDYAASEALDHLHMMGEVAGVRRPGRMVAYYNRADGEPIDEPLWADLKMIAEHLRRERAMLSGHTLTAPMMIAIDCLELVSERLEEDERRRSGEAGQGPSVARVPGHGGVPSNHDKESR